MENILIEKYLNILLKEAKYSLNNANVIIEDRLEIDVKKDRELFDTIIEQSLGLGKILGYFTRINEEPNGSFSYELTSTGLIQKGYIINANYTEMVSNFHKTFNAPILDTPKIPSQKRCDLRVSLLQEELDELKDAINNNDLVEILDAITDLEYILHGTILEFGLQNIFNIAFDEVQRSNMSKACNNEEEAKATLEHYFEKDGTKGYYKENNGKWIVYREGDDKVLKSVNYSPASLKTILD